MHQGRLQTRQWEDDAKLRHWKTEIVASSVEMLSGKRRRITRPSRLPRPSPRRPWPWASPEDHVIEMDSSDESADEESTIENAEAGDKSQPEPRPSEAKQVGDAAGRLLLARRSPMRRPCCSMVLVLACARSARVACRLRASVG